MKTLLALVVAAVLSGCATSVSTMPAAPRVAPAQAAQLVDASGVPIERVPYRVGVSSVTVEQLARQHACVGQGAGLVTEPGPVEVYRLQCSDGKVFMARCELRQCRKM
jgi:curli biogenesis system outer membrane secretion channel CsgG